MSCNSVLGFIYIIANQTNISLADVWDGKDLKISLRRKVSHRLMQSWFDLVSTVESVSLNEDCDAIIYAFDGSSRFAVNSMYKTINFRGVMPVHKPAIWQLSAAQNTYFPLAYF